MHIPLWVAVWTKLIVRPSLWVAFVSPSFQGTIWPWVTSRVRYNFANNSASRLTCKHGIHVCRAQLPPIATDSRRQAASLSPPLQRSVIDLSVLLQALTDYSNNSPSASASIAMLHLRQRACMCERSIQFFGCVSVILRKRVAQSSPLNGFY